MNNEKRAEYGMAALNDFTINVYGGRTVDELDPDDVWCAAYDLICDLGHALRKYREENAGKEGLWWNEREISDIELVNEVTAMAHLHFSEEIKLDWKENDSGLPRNDS